MATNWIEKAKSLNAPGGTNQIPAAGFAKPTPPAPKPPVKAAASPSAPTKPPTSQSLGTMEKLTYPLDGIKYGIIFKFAPYNRESALKDNVLIHEQLIQLPMPAGLAEGFQSVYNNRLAFGELGNLLRVMVNDGINAVQSGGDAKQVLAAVGGNLRDRIKRGGQDDSAVKSLLSGGARGLGETAGAGFDMMAGTTPNPHLAVAYQSPALRQMTFSWRFAPQNWEESMALIEIFNAFKQRMLPGKQEFALTYPDLCDVELTPKILNDLIKIKTCVVTDMKVNYAPNGVPSFFATSQVPTEMEFTVSLQETKIFTREDFDIVPVPAGGKKKDDNKTTTISGTPSIPPNLT